jgi:hypothetical protein
MKTMGFVKLFVLVAVVFASTNVLFSQSVNHWELVVNASDTWSYRLGTTAPEANWHTKDYDASQWLTGPGGIGYGENNEGTVISQTGSLYLRIKFNIVSKSELELIQLFIDFDDAFVAYLNGTEIARANIGTAGQMPVHSQFANNCDYEAQIPKGGMPASFIVDKNLINTNIVEGENVLAIQVHNCNTTSSDLASTTFLIAGINTTSRHYREAPQWFLSQIVQSSLPLLLIHTGGAEIPDEDKIMASLKIIHNGDGKTNTIYDLPNIYDGFMGIEIRGQSSQMFPKKSYGIETRLQNGDDNAVGLLGMPAEADWVLYAPYSDKSLLRNDLTYFLGQKMGAWQPRFRWVEVYLNNSYHGLYMLVEKIKRDKNRVNIKKIEVTDISGDKLTGGYIIKVDKTWDLTADEFFITTPANKYLNARNYSFTYEYPKAEDIVSAQKNYIKNYITELENVLNGPNFKDQANGFRKYMDIPSFVDFQIMQELTNNVDGYRYSTFFHKKRDSDGGKLFAGPLWDFDLCYGNVNYAPDRLSTSKWLYPSFGPGEEHCMHWWARLMEDQGYSNALSERWNAIRKGPFKTDSIMNYIDQSTEKLGPAIARNFKRWPILNEYVWPNNYVGNTHPNEITYLKNWITNRLTWLDNNMPKLTSTGGKIERADNFTIFPNPAKEGFQIRINSTHMSILNIEILDLSGRLVHSEVYKTVLPGIQDVGIRIPAGLEGNFLLRLKNGSNVVATKNIVIYK